MELGLKKRYVGKMVISTFFMGWASLSLWAGGDNIALLAVASASETTIGFGEQSVNDGQVHFDGMGEWASNSSMNFWGGINYPWVQLDWETPQTTNRVVLYDRPSLGSHTAGGTLFFSDGSEISVTAMENNGSPKTIVFPEKEIQWVRFQLTDGDGDRLGLSEMEVFAAPSDYTDMVSWVDPYIETTRGRYFYFVTGSRPFGMIGAAPMTRNKNQMGGGYNYNSLEILGFPQVHGWMLSGLNLMPTTGKRDPTLGEQHWKSRFSHEDETVGPGYHKVFLGDYGIWVEQTATERTSFYRFRYTDDSDSSILLNLGGYLGTTTMTDAKVAKVGDREIEGSVNTTGRLWGGPDNVRIYFVVQIDRPVRELNGWIGDQRQMDISHLNGASGSTPKNAGQSYHDSPTTGISFEHNVKKGEVIQMKIAISYTSVENARNNLLRESPHWQFEKVKKEAVGEWDRWLGKIKVKGGTDAQKIKFYTDLWHALLGRHKIDDINGDYPDYTQGERQGAKTVNAQLRVRTVPKHKKGTPKFHMYNSDAFWLTQWNLNILWGLAWPEMLDEFSASLVQYADNGGLLPRGPNAGGYSYIMTGCPATPLIVSAYTKGLLTKVDDQHAYAAMKRNHMPGGMLEVDKDYLEKGYFMDGWGSAGRTLEACFQDWSLAQMAKGLKKNRDASYFLKRSEGWKNLFNEEHGLIFPKDKEGKWLHTDPLSGAGWVEANSWQATWSVSHDIKSLAALLGGPDRLCDKLNFAFEQAEPTDFVFSYGSGYVSYANQPGCSNAHVFNHAGKPWLSQKWAREVNEKAYGAITPDKGYGGHDEDQGQMGAVSALMSMGLFSLQGTASLRPTYDITSPVFDEVKIALDPTYYPGTEFVIRTYHNSQENGYIQKAQLNGKPLETFWFEHAQFIQGGLLELWMGPAPNKEWGTERTK
ncbi:MAG: GH92 family glycosyl hydrolase [Sediminicola sp.]